MCILLFGYKLFKVVVNSTSTTFINYLRNKKNIYKGGDYFRDNSTESRRHLYDFILNSLPSSRLQFLHIVYNYTYKASVVKCADGLCYANKSMKLNRNKSFSTLLITKLKCNQF